MKAYGKVFGAVLGWMLFRHPVGAVIGGLLGHALDAGWLRGSTRRAAAPAAETDPELESLHILGLERGASDEAIERAFRRLISDYHPDKVASAAKEIRDLAQVRASAINRAYESLQKRRRPR